MRNMKVALALLAILPMSANLAFSMAITNQDGEVRKITVTENGERQDFEIGPNETTTLCEQGCFITFPDGTLTAYQGSETIVIRNGGPALSN